MNKSWDPVWEEIFSTRDWGKYPNEDLIRFVARNFYRAPKRGDIKILEVGSGTGANLWYVAREGFSVYGIDGSESGVELTIRRLNEEVPGWQGEILVGDIVSLEYPDEYFDGAIDNEAICANSFENAAKIYNELHRVLKPGGKLYTRAFTTETVGFETGKEVGRNAFLPDVGPLEGKGYTRYSTEECMRLFLSSFEILELDKVSRGYGDLDTIAEWSIVAQKPTG